MKSKGNYSGKKVSFSYISRSQKWQQMLHVRSSVLPEFPSDRVRGERKTQISRRQLWLLSPFLQLLPESCFLRSAPLIWVAWAKMQSKRVRLSKMINLHALVLRPSLLATALTMSYCQLSWGREQQFSYNAAFTSRPAGRTKMPFFSPIPYFPQCTHRLVPTAFLPNFWIESWQRENWNDFQQYEIWDFTQEQK